MASILSTATSVLTGSSSSGSSSSGSDYLNLNTIRKNFKPRHNHRWSVKFSDSKLQIISGFFPAKSVTWNKYTIVSDDVTVAPGLTIRLNSYLQKMNTLTIDYYETHDCKVSSFFSSYTSKLKNALNSMSSELTVTIVQYDDTGKSDTTDTYIVELAGTYSETLGQSPAPDEGTLTLNIIGDNTSGSSSSSSSGLLSSLTGGSSLTSAIGL